MFELVLSLIGAICIKVILCYLIFVILRRYCRDNLEAIVASWGVLHCLIIGTMLGLSMWQALSPFYFSSIMIVEILVVFGYVRKQSLQLYYPDFSVLRSKFEAVWLLIGASAFGALLLHSLVFYDTTWDGLTYGLPRIFFWAQRESILAYDATRAINIFCNEWNGTLNAVFYVSLTGQDQTASFGNVEIWLVNLLAITWLSGVLGIQSRYRLILGLICMSFPVVTALALTVKDDLLAIGMFCMSIGSIIQAKRYNEEYQYALSIMFLGLAAGSKITLLPFVALSLFLYLPDILRRKVYEKKLFFLGIVGFIIGTWRYILNLIYYGNPVQRVAGETGSVSLSNLYGNVMGLLYASVDSLINPLINQGAPFWALSQSVGYWGLIIYMCLGLLSFVCVPALQHSRERVYREFFDARTWLSLVGIPFSISLIILLTSTKWYSFCFRYYTPWIVVTVLLIGRVIIDCCTKKRMTKFIGWLLGVTVSFHFAVCFQVGEVSPSYKNSYKYLT